MIMDDDRDRMERKGRWALGGSGRRFTACVDFEAGPFNYVEGGAYTADSEALDALVDEWLADGRVKLGGGKAQLLGKGN